MVGPRRYLKRSSSGIISGDVTPKFRKFVGFLKGTRASLLKETRFSELKDPTFLDFITNATTVVGFKVYAKTKRKKITIKDAQYTILSQLLFIKEN